MNLGDMINLKSNEIIYFSKVIENVEIILGITGYTKSLRHFRFLRIYALF